jgi:hypothetical protein
MHLRRAQPCTSAAHSRAAAPLCRRAPSRTHALSHAAPAVSQACRLMLASPHTTCPRASAYYVLPRRPLLHHIPWQTFAQNRSDAYSFCSSLQDARRPHDQGCRHPPLAPDEGDSHLQHRRDPTRQALPQEEAGADQDQPHPSAQVARRLLRAGLRWRHGSTYPVRGRRGPSSRARGLEACLEVERRGLEDVMRHEVRGRGRAPRTR